MSLLDKLKTGIYGLGGNRPQTFGVNPIPPNSLHLKYSTDGAPNITWRTINGTGPVPMPSRLDINDSKDKYGPTNKYGR
jgi:hypothetical protein